MAVTAKPTATTAVITHPDGCTASRRSSTVPPGRSIPNGSLTSSGTSAIDRRSKGTAWLATNEMRVSIAQAGPVRQGATAQGPWIAEASPRSQRDIGQNQAEPPDGTTSTGDRRTELVFIGTDFRRSGQARAALEDLVVTDEERETNLDGPFPTEQGDDRYPSRSRAQSQPVERSEAHLRAKSGQTGSPSRSTSLVRTAQSSRTR